MKKAIIALLLVAASLAGLLGIAQAQTGSGYDLTWHTVDGGGTAFSSGGGYQVAGTVGQADAGLQRGGPYSLQGGFWYGAYLRQVYLPLVSRGI